MDTHLLKTRAERLAAYEREAREWQRAAEQYRAAPPSLDNYRLAKMSEDFAASFQQMADEIRKQG